MFVNPVQALLGHEEFQKRFRNIRLLGKGAAGSVYYAQDAERAGEPVAVKILFDVQAFDRHTRERFRREMDIMRSIHHPNLVTAYDVLEFGDTLAFTLEYLDGSDLASWMKRMPKPSAAEVQFVFSEILLGLHELHEKNIIHRDLKLENIFLDSSGSPKIGDLGLTKELHADGLTSTGILLGTAQYLPPEYIKHAQFDRRGDLYAIGTMMLEVLSQKRRLSDLRGIQAVERLVAQGFALADDEKQGVPPHMLAIIERAMAVQPRDRYQHAIEMRRDLLLSEEEFFAQEKAKIVGSKRKQKSPARRVFLFLIALCLGIGASFVAVYFF